MKKRGAWRRGPTNGKAKGRKRSSRRSLGLCSGDNDLDDDLEVILPPCRVQGTAMKRHVIPAAPWRRGSSGKQAGS